MSKTALVIVDVQNDFLPGGALGVTDGDQIIDTLIEIGNKVDLVAFTRDFHPADHCSFTDEPKFEDKSWPPHCVQDTEGVQLHGKLARAFENRLAPVFSKGMDRDREQYSGAEAVSRFGSGAEPKTLTEWLKDNGVTYVIVGGLALDYCVKGTALDLGAHFETDVVIEATRPVNFITGVLAIKELENADSLPVFTISKDEALAEVEAKKG